MYLKLELQAKHYEEVGEVILPIVIYSRGGYVPDPFALISELGIYDLPPYLKNKERERLTKDIRELKHLGLGKTSVSNELKIRKKLL